MVTDIKCIKAFKLKMLNLKRHYVKSSTMQIAKHFYSATVIFYTAFL